MIYNFIAWLKKKQEQRGSHFFHLVFCLWATWTAVLPGTYAGPQDADISQPLQIAFSSSMFTEVDMEDARAAMKVWIMTVAKERGIPIDFNPYILLGREGLTKFALNRSVVGIALTTPEYARLHQKIKFNQIALGLQDERITETYYVLVRMESGIERLEQLQGQNLNILHTPRMSLAVIWLDTILLDAGLGRTEAFFDRVTFSNKAAQVVLPVFFGRDKACLTTRASFEVMGELNPQLNTQLRVLAVSPEFIPSCFAFREDYTSAHRASILDAMERFGDSPAGRQILVLIHSERVEKRPVSYLKKSLELVTRHQRLCHENNIAPSGKRLGETTEKVE